MSKDYTKTVHLDTGFGLSGSPDAIIAALQELADRVPAEYRGTARFFVSHTILKYDRPMTEEEIAAEKAKEEDEGRIEAEERAELKRLLEKYVTGDEDDG